MPWNTKYSAMLQYFHFSLLDDRWSQSPAPPTLQSIPIEGYKGHIKKSHEFCSLTQGTCIWPVKDEVRELIKSQVRVNDLNNNSREP